MLQTLLAAGAGGFIGSCLRYIINNVFSNANGTNFPWATLIVNLIGCFLFGLFFGWLLKNDYLNSSIYAFLITGFCGGLTTFSTFSNELVNLSSLGEWFTFGLYFTLSLIGGFFLLILGREIIMK